MRNIVVKFVFGYVAMIVTIVAIAFPGQLLLEWFTDRRLVFVQTFLLYFIAVSISMIVHSQTSRFLIKMEARRELPPKTAREEEIERLFDAQWFKLLAISVCSAIAAVVIGFLR